MADNECNITDVQMKKTLPEQDLLGRLKVLAEGLDNLLAHYALYHIAVNGMINEDQDEHCAIGFRIVQSGLSNTHSRLIEDANAIQRCYRRQVYEAGYVI